MVFEYLKPFGDVERRDTFTNKLIKKHVDKIAWKDYIYRKENEFLLLQKGSDRRLLGGFEQRLDILSCCGLIGIQNFGNSSFLAFQKEFWETLKNRTYKPLIFVLAKVDGVYLYPNYKFMADNSVEIGSFRNVGYSNHILSTHLMWHDEGMETLMDSTSPTREIFMKQEMVQP